MSILVYRNSKSQVYKIPIPDFEKRTGIHYLDSLTFEYPEHKKKLMALTKKRLKRSLISRMNAWTLALHQDSMKNPHEDLFYIKWINRYLGYGVFAAQDIPALCYIGEYLGVVRKRRFRKYRFNDYVFGYIAANKETPFIIDAQEKGNFSRFINHSYNPNLTSRWVIQGDLTHIIFFANKLIPKDSQLTYDYGDYFWRSRSSPSLIN